MIRPISRIAISRCSPAVLSALVLGAAGTAAAAPLTEADCHAKCPNIPAPPKNWTTTVGHVECVEYANYRSKLKHSGNAWTWAEYPKCSGESGVTCVQDNPEPGTVMVSQPYQNQAYGAGHVAVVDCVVGDWVKVSEYNWTPGVFKGDRCINVKEARDKDTPFAFVRAFGSLFPAEGERCEDPLKISHAFVKPDPNDKLAKRGTVEISFGTSACSRAKFRLHRKIWKFEGGTKVLHEQWTKPVKNVRDIYTDTFEDVPTCSQFEYVLEREMVDPPIVGAKIKQSPAMTGVNLEPPSLVTADFVPKVYGQMFLRWKSACPNYAGSTKTQYQIVYSRGIGNPVTVGPVDGTVIPGNGPQDREHKLVSLFGATNYSVSVRTFNYSDVSATTADGVFTTPAPNNTTPAPLPQRPKLAMRCGDGKLDASWVAAAGGESYELEFTGPSTQVPKPKPVIVPAVGLTHSFDAAVDANYTVRLRSYRAGKPSAWTDPVVFARDCVAEAPLVSPLVNDDCAGVKLTWKPDPAATAAHLKKYEIMRREEGGQLQPIASTLPTVLTYNDIEASPGKHYFYSVRALFQTPEGKPLVSPPAPQSPVVIPKSPPRAPEIEKITTRVDRATLEFTDNATNETEFIIKRWTDNESGALVQYRIDGKQGTGKVTFADPNPLPIEDRSYRYRVFAVKGACKETNVTASLPVEGRRMRPPVNVTVAKDSSDGALLKWQDTNHRVTSYEIYRKQLSEPVWSASPIATVSSDKKSYVDMAKVDAQYSVKAIFNGERTLSDGVGSAPVTYLRQTSKACPAGGTKPVLTRVTNLDDPRRSKVEFTYDAPASFATRIEYARGTNGPWLTVQETNAKAGPVDIDVSPFMNQQIWLRVIGFDPTNNCVSAPSTPHVVYPLPAPVPLPTVPAHKNCPQGLLVKWVDTSTYGSKFQVEWQPDIHAPWQPMPKEDYFRVTGTKEVWQCHKPVAADAGYQYRVRSTYHVLKSGKPDVLSTSRWSNDAGVSDGGGAAMSLANGTMESIPAYGKPGDRLQNWGPEGAWTLHELHDRPGRQGLGLRFGYYSAGSETVGQILDATFEAGTTYTFKGHVNGGGDKTGKVPFQIGYLTNTSDIMTFKPLATEKFSAGNDWTAVKGVTHTVKAGDVAVGKRIVVRLGGGSDGGSTDIWFDNLTLIAK
ncbi:CHAP domain-containing protein [Nannocystis bainbridge]|uniref:CHAP domain-containing protein n=1 Tax=Nannocystis bainbridge TaxID=2995303 RepID=A0ABT5DWB0_9BACT|nr:CHAP domain-containing protein [Nannocystis bainbridge]MDC0716702.1 CHAP domain-containing protein [Nannocystis bainbridge]